MGTSPAFWGTGNIQSVMRWLEPMIQNLSRLRLGNTGGDSRRWIEEGAKQSTGSQWREKKQAGVHREGGKLRWLAKREKERERERSILEMPESLVSFRNKLGMRCSASCSNLPVFLLVRKASRNSVPGHAELPWWTTRKLTCSHSHKQNWTS